MVFFFPFSSRIPSRVMNCIYFLSLESSFIWKSFFVFLNLVFLREQAKYFVRYSSVYICLIILSELDASQAFVAGVSQKRHCFLRASDCSYSVPLLVTKTLIAQLMWYLPDTTLYFSFFNLHLTYGEIL